MTRNIPTLILSLCIVAPLPVEAPPPALPTRNVIWNRFVSLSRSSTTDLQEVQRYLADHAEEPTLRELDASTVLRLDHAVRVRRDETGALEELRDELVNPKGVTK